MLYYGRGILMSDLTIEELAKSEREFLHDISNHIVVAQGMTNFVFRALKENKPAEAKDIERLEKAIEAISKMVTTLKERRALLHSISVK